MPLLGAGAGVGDLGGHVGILLGKVLGEHIGQLVGLLVVGCLVGPHAAGVQHLGGHAGAAGGVVDVKDVVVLELDAVKAAVQSGGDHGLLLLNLLAHYLLNALKKHHHILSQHIHESFLLNC